MPELEALQRFYDHRIRVCRRVGSRQKAGWALPLRRPAYAFRVTLVGLTAFFLPGLHIDD